MKKRKTRRTTKRTTRRTRKTTRKSKRPIGYVKTRGGYALVFGSKTKPKLGRKFKTKTSLARHVAKTFRRRKK